MKFLLPIGLIVTLSACEMATTVSQVNTADADPTSPKQSSLSHMKFKTCPSDDSLNSKTSTHSLDCESAQDGVITVVHPAQEVDIALEQVSKPNTFDNLWEKLQHQLNMPLPENEPRFDAQKKWYLSHPAYMQRVSKRARPFLYYIMQRLEQENMPMELALLPIVESGFDPFAYSHGRASGMWQFIPATGKRFGMKQTWWYDGRRDVVAATDGAIEYLRYLNNMFDGDWLHALAAYNSGEGRVMRAIQKNKRAGKPTDFWSLDLPRETRAYVPKLLALADILKHQDEYQFSWPVIANAPVLEVVDVGSQIDLAVAASMANLTIAELQSLNPGYNKWATDPDGPHRLLIPIDKAEKFAINLAQMSSKDRVNWIRHKVKSGESLGILARKYATSVRVIKQVNNLNSNMIVVNDYVLIPVSLKDLDAYSLSVDQRLAKTQSIKRANYQVKHKVASGDTLWDIAMANKVGVRELARWNKMAPTDPLKVGANLVIWTNDATIPNANPPVMRNVVYTVRSGDSLARIANRFKVKVTDLTQWNNLHNKKYLQPGQKLKIKVDVKQS